MIVMERPAEDTQGDTKQEKGREEAETDPDKRQLMDDLKPDHNGEYYDGDSDQDGEEVGGTEEAS